MTINKVNGTAHISHVGDTKSVGTKPQGFELHWPFVGPILSVFGLAFKDKDVKWANKKSVINYLQRNQAGLNLSDADKQSIAQLHAKSTAKEVKKLFTKVKNAGSLPIDSGVKIAPLTAEQRVEQIQKWKDKCAGPVDSVAETFIEKLVDANTPLSPFKKIVFCYDPKTQFFGEGGVTDLYVGDESDEDPKNIFHYPPNSILVVVLKPSDGTVDSYRRLADNQPGNEKWLLMTEFQTDLRKVKVIDLPLKDHETLSELMDKSIIDSVDTQAQLILEFERQCKLQFDQFPDKKMIQGLLVMSNGDHQMVLDISSEKSAFPNLNEKAKTLIDASKYDTEPYFPAGEAVALFIIKREGRDNLSAVSINQNGRVSYGDIHPNAFANPERLALTWQIHHGLTGENINTIFADFTNKVGRTREQQPAPLSNPDIEVSKEEESGGQIKGDTSPIMNLVGLSLSEINKKLSQMGHVTELRLDPATTTDETLKKIKDLTNLTKLDLSGCERITDNGLISLKELTQLTSLDLSVCQQITDKGMIHLKNLNNLTHLNLNSCNKITDHGLDSLKSMKKLTSLDLSGLFRITDKGVAILRAFTELNDLSIQSHEMTDASLLSLLKLLRNLTSLNVPGCRTITDDALRSVKKDYPNLNLVAFLADRDRNI